MYYQGERIGDVYILVGLLSVILSSSERIGGIWYNVHSTHDIEVNRWISYHICYKYHRIKRIWYEPHPFESIWLIQCGLYNVRWMLSTVIIDRVISRRSHESISLYKALRWWILQGWSRARMRGLALAINSYSISVIAQHSFKWCGVFENKGIIHVYDRWNWPWRTWSGWILVYSISLHSAMLTIAQRRRSWTRSALPWNNWRGCDRQDLEQSWS